MSIRVFIAGTTENRDLVESMVAFMQRAFGSALTPKPWYACFPPGEYTLESLSHVVDETDAAFLLLTPDDTVRSRGKQSPAARDNLLLEAGMFLSRHGRDRTFMFIPEPTDPGGGKNRVKRPSDLHGLTVSPFSFPKGVSFDDSGFPVELRKACEKVQKLGQRSHEAVSEFASLGTFRQLEKTVTVNGPVEVLTTQWLLQYLDEATQIDLVNAYRINDFVRQGLGRFRKRRGARLRCCFIDAWDLPLVNVFQRKVVDRSATQIQESLLSSVQKLLALPHQPKNGERFPNIPMPETSDVATIDIYLTSQRPTYTFCRIDDRAIIVPLDMKHTQDPPPRAWAISRATCPLAFDYYLADSDKLFAEATHVFPG